jgi:hypothetical protein
MAGRWAFALLLVSSPAAAIGLCEGLKREFTVTAQSEKLRAFVVREDVETCKETETGEERVLWRSYDVRDALGLTRRTFVEGEGDAVARFRKDGPPRGPSSVTVCGVAGLDMATRDGAALPVPAAPGTSADDHGAEAARCRSLSMDEAPVEPARAMRAFLEKNGFRPVRPAPQGSNDRCRVELVRIDSGDDAGAYRMKVFGGDKVWYDEGPIHVVETEPAVWFLPGPRAIAIRTREPGGGPPPGYFGDDDPGSQYTKDELNVVKIAKQPQLAVCFETLPP